MQQLVGVPIFFTYVTYFFAQSGIDDPFQATVIVDCIIFGGLIISFWTAELVGWRPLLLGGAVSMCVWMVGLGLSGSFKTVNNVAALVTSCFSVLTYALTSAPVAFMTSSENSTPRLRAYTNGFSLAIFGSLGTMFTFVVPYMLNQQGADMGLKSAYVFAGGCIVSLVLVYFFEPETAGRTYAEIDELYESGISVRKFSKAETSSRREGAFDRTQAGRA